MLAKVLSSAVIGIDAYLVEVEVDITQGLPTFTTVGLPEASVKESKERVRSAINNSGYSFPVEKITVNLAPAIAFVRITFRLEQPINTLKGAQALH